MPGDRDTIARPTPPPPRFRSRRWRAASASCTMVESERGTVTLLELLSDRDAAWLGLRVVSRAPPPTWSETAGFRVEREVGRFVRERAPRVEVAYFVHRDRNGTRWHTHVTTHPPPAGDALAADVASRPAPPRLPGFTVSGTSAPVLVSLTRAADARVVHAMMRCAVHVAATESLGRRDVGAPIDARETNLRIEGRVEPARIVLSGDGLRIAEEEIRWPELRGVRAVDPWPAAEVAWIDVLGTPRSTVLRPREPRDRQELAARALALFDVAGAALGPGGWREAPEVPWEPAPALPADAEPGGGAYRSAGRAERVVARRPPLGGLDRMWRWLGRSRRGAPDHRQVVLTDEHAYAEEHGGGVFRVPLSALRTRLGDRDAVYVFGRRTQLVLPHRDGCPVRLALDARLGYEA